MITLSQDISVTTSDQYFVIESDYVDFNGNSYTVNINNVPNYPGLIQNGSLSDYGYDDVTVNGIIVVSNDASLLSYGGWIGQAYFAYGVNNVTISNCSSNGIIRDFGGGITGAYSNCTVSNSHSSGAMLMGAGGIFGRGSEGSAIHCHSSGGGDSFTGGIFGYQCSGDATNCYSTGDIYGDGGGISGYNGTGNISECYSTGNIFSYGGGIAGYYHSGTIVNCYSTGTIGDQAGGITAWSNQGTITNSYSAGIISSGAGGIGGPEDEGTTSNCYTANGNWNDEDANNNLLSVGNMVSTWIAIPTNMPYKLASFNEIIYSPDNANVSQNTSSSFVAGNFTTGSYSIINITGDPSGYPAFTINAGDGTISVSNAVAGSYVLKVLYSDYSDGSYQLNSFTVEVLSTLPVTWLSFTATPKANMAWLQWSTANEQNSRDFTIQHSANGSNWTTISTVRAAGNSTAVSNYNYLHADPVTGNNFYRIQQNDLDGNHSYSAVKKIQIGFSDKIFSVVNTIVDNGVLQVRIKMQALLELYTTDGRLVWQNQFSEGLQIINLSTVPAGIYLLRGKDTVEKILIR